MGQEYQRITFYLLATYHCDLRAIPLAYHETRICPLHRTLFTPILGSWLNPEYPEV